MRTVILYSYPLEPDGLSLQGEWLYRGMKKNGEKVMPCHLSSEFQKEWTYRYFKPDVAIGVGFWGHTPDIILHPQKFGVTPIPWFVADGWVANYKEVISSLPLVLATSTWVKKTYERDGVNTKNFEVVPIGFDFNLYKPIPRSHPGVRQVRRALSIGDDEIMILTAGGDVTSKGAQEVLKALKIIDQRFKKWKYVCKIWGGASAEDHYKDESQLIEELGPSKEKVKYVEGSLSPDFMPYLLNACDIYAAPSRLEGFGMIQVEAQACGVPVISINEMGPKETIMHGKTGFLAKVAGTAELTEEWVYPSMGFEEQKKIVFEKPKIFAYRADVNDIAEYLLRLMLDKKLREKMGRQAHRHAIKNFDNQDIARKVVSLIRKHLGRP